MVCRSLNLQHSKLFSCMINLPRERTHPPTSFIKFNCDGAYSSSRSIAAFGFLAKDSGGLSQFCRSGKVRAPSALFIEAWTLHIAWGIAVDLGIKDAVFESDCRMVIDCLRNGNYQCPWEIAAMVEDMKCWTASRNWTFSWVSREHNRAAHWLAPNCHDRNFVFNPGCSSPGLEGLLVKDRPS